MEDQPKDVIPQLDQTPKTPSPPRPLRVSELDTLLSGLVFNGVDEDFE